jgi:hypothetical protein
MALCVGALYKENDDNAMNIISSNYLLVWNKGTLAIMFGWRGEDGEKEEEEDEMAERVRFFVLFCFFVLVYLFMDGCVQIRVCFFFWLFLLIYIYLWL